MAAMWRGVPELHVAIHRGQFHDARQLVSAGDDVNCRDANHRTPLILCALVEQEQWGVGIARMLLEMGALAGLVDKQGRNALIYACIYRRLELVEVLLSAVDFDLNHRDRFGNTALFYAASGGNADVVATVVKKFKHFGETLDKPNKFGMTPLLEACRLGHERVARTLVENGAKVERRDGVRHWNAVDWQQEHDRHVEATNRARNRSYNKPWLSTKNTSVGKSEPGQLRRATSLPGISGSDCHGLSDGRSSSESMDPIVPERAQSVPRHTLSRAKTMSVLPTLNSAKLVGVTRNWISDTGGKELIRAKFYPSPAPFANPQLTTDAERTHNAYGQWRMTQNLHPVNSLSSRQHNQSDSAIWQKEFRQIFKRYENQVSKSFRRKARVPPPGYRFRSHSPPQITQPSITVDGDRKAPSGRLSRRQSNLDFGPPLKRLPSVNSIDTSSVSSRKATAPSSAVKGGRRDPDSSSSSVDSAGAAKMVMNAFRRRKSTAFSSSSSIVKTSEDETESKVGNSGSDRSAATGRVRKTSITGTRGGGAIAVENGDKNITT
ncbi:ankyrin repeat domain-containing protein 50-like [Acanthaster planci]|uniref:Ankyrin repeat domain-containing protein 50-like n=1 Tax=Acanthaster planci TaxID=133434 RepID=A0A8B7Z3K4_ACAPL|nr:ankyrin repeat domain-containing protein 50-like [Acanthaster planci]